MADFPLFVATIVPGDGRLRGDGPAFDDGVVTTMPLIGVLAELLGGFRS